MEKIGWVKITRLLARLCLLSSLFVIPLGMSFFFPIFSPFTGIKEAWLQILSALLLLFSILSMRLSLPKGYLKSIAPVWIFWAAWALLSVFSPDPVRAWFGSYERHFGLLNYFWLAVWYSLAVIYFRELMLTRAAAVIIAVVGGIIGAYAFMQFCGFDFALWQEPQLLSRAIGTLGQPNFLGSLMLLTLPLSAFGFSFVRTLRGRAFLFVSIISQLTGLIVSGSRAAWLSFLIVGAAVVGYFCWRRFGRRSILIALATVLISAGIIFAMMPSRFAAAFDPEGGSFALRRLFYQSAVDVISQRPLLGVGLENGGEALVRQYQPEWGIFMAIDGYTDKVHNNLLDVIIQVGFLGLIPYLLLYLFFAWQCWLLFKRPESRTFALAAAAAMAAYGLSLLFGLSDIANVFYLWTIAAMVAAGNLIGKEYPVSLRLKKAAAAALGAALALFCLAQIIFSLSNLQADYYYLQTQRLLPQKEFFSVAEIYSYLDEAALNPAYRDHYRRSVVALFLSDFEKAEDLSSQAALRQVLGGIERQLPDDSYEDRMAQARLACFFGRGAGGFDRLIAESPLRPLAYRERGRCQEGERAIADYDKAISLLPDFNDPRLNAEHRNYLYYYAYRLEYEKAAAYRLAGRESEALHSFRRAYSYFPEDVSLLLDIAVLYEKMGERASASSSLKHAYLRQPKNYQWPLALAALAQRSGDKALAIDYARQASALAPAEALPLPTN